MLQGRLYELEVPSNLDSAGRIDKANFGLSVSSTVVGRDDAEYKSGGGATRPSASAGRIEEARELLKQAKEHPGSLPAAIRCGLGKSGQAHRLMAAIPRAAADEAVLTKHLAVGRYATALLVRLRRMKRQEAGGSAPFPMTMIVR